MVALTQFTVLLGALVSLSAAAPTATSTSAPAPTSISTYGGSTALAMQIFVHHVTDASAGQLCASDADCKAALEKLDAKRQALAAAQDNKNQKRKLSPLSLIGGPWSLAYELAMSTDEGQKIHGYAVKFLRGVCNEDATCKEALAGYDKYVKPVTDKVDQVESDAEDAVLGKAEDLIKDIF